MKYVLTALLVIFGSIYAPAQQHDVYADFGISGARLNLGLSATYNYRPLKWLGIGIGAQAFDFFPTITHDHQYVPAIYGDLRLNIRPEKRNQFFAFLDIGVNFFRYSDSYYRSGDNIYYVPLNKGNYTGVGFGYFRSVTQRGWGPYITLKVIGNGYSANAFDIVSRETSVYKGGRGCPVLSFGFRF